MPRRKLTSVPRRSLCGHLNRLECLNRIVADAFDLIGGFQVELQDQQLYDFAYLSAFEITLWISGLPKMHDQRRLVAANPVTANSLDPKNYIDASLCQRFGSFE